jgi:hypothetical protein
LIREQKTIFLLIVVSLLITLGASQIDGIKLVDLTIETDEDWLTYEPISDINSNSSKYALLIDSDNNFHIFWSSNNQITNVSSLVYEIRFSNGSSISSNIKEVTGDIDFYFHVDIDSSNQIHLFISNSTIKKVEYFLGTFNSLSIISEVEVTTSQGYCAVIDSSDTAHIIYHGKEGNIYDKIYSDNEWQDQKITNYYESNETPVYISTSFFRTAKSSQGKIAILYNYWLSTDILGKYSIDQLHCLIFDGEVWSDPIILAEYQAFYYTLAFDDIETLHLMWFNNDENFDTHYRTVSNNKWSKIYDVKILESTGSQYDYVAINDLDLELQGNTLLLAYNAIVFLNPTGFDYDLFIAKSTDGRNWVSEPVYTNNSTESRIPTVESTNDGDVFVMALELDFDFNYNWTIHFGFAEDYFTYQSTVVSLHPLILILAIPVVIFVHKKKIKRSNS